MRNINLIVVIISIISISYSCCKKGPYPVAALKVSYPDLSNAETLNAIRTINNFSVIIDTISLGELNASNSFSAIIEFDNDPPNYILYIENTTYIDTISEIVIQRKGCKEKIDKFQYKLNGDILTNNYLEIKK